MEDASFKAGPLWLLEDVELEAVARQYCRPLSVHHQLPSVMDRAEDVVAAAAVAHHQLRLGTDRVEDAAAAVARYKAVMVAVLPVVEAALTALQVVKILRRPKALLTRRCLLSKPYAWMA